MPRPRGNARSQPGSVARQQPGAFRDLVRGYPVIPAMRATADLARAGSSRSRVVYLLAAGLSTLDEQMHTLRTAGKEVVVNLDLFAGLSRTAEAVAYLAQSGCAGIISTHTDVLGAAQKEGLFAVQRTFLIDSDSVSSCMRSLGRFVPDALELLPAAVAPHILPRLRQHYAAVATVGGGLIADLQQADALIRQGLDAISTGNPELWNV